MSTQTFACPACGQHKTLEDPQPGEKLHCTCGMSFPASPVFGVPNATRGNRLSGTGWAVGIVAAMLIGSAAAAGWLMTRPNAAPPETSGEQVAVVPAAVPDVTPNPTPSADPPPTNPNPPQPAPAPPAPPAPPPPPPPMPVAAESLTAVTLWDAFDLDPNAAAKYSGKVLEVTGRGKVAKDSFGRTYFGAEVVKPRGKTSARLTPDERRWEKEGYPASVRCYLTPEQAEVLEKLPADRDVVFRGTCTGRKDRQDVYRGYIVELDNCTVVAPR
jgi:hypothetical protein